MGGLARLDLKGHGPDGRSAAEDPSGGLFCSEAARGAGANGVGLGGEKSSARRFKAGWAAHRVQAIVGDRAMTERRKDRRHGRPSASSAWKPAPSRAAATREMRAAIDVLPVTDKTSDRLT